MIGLDTSAIIDLFRGNEELKKIIENNKEPFVITQISYLELMFGIDNLNSKHEIECKFYDRLFDKLLVLDLNKASCRKASDIFFELKKKGKMIEQLDCTIAGILLSNGINKLITKNKKHFENISGIKVIYY